jgi:hypothetical protein
LGSTGPHRHGLCHCIWGGLGWVVVGGRVGSRAPTGAGSHLRCDICHWSNLARMAPKGKRKATAFGRASLGPSLADLPEPAFPPRASALATVGPSHVAEPLDGLNTGQLVAALATGPFRPQALQSSSTAAGKRRDTPVFAPSKRASRVVARSAAASSEAMEQALALYERDKSASSASSSRDSNLATWIQFHHDWFKDEEWLPLTRAWPACLSKEAIVPILTISRE